MKKTKQYDVVVMGSGIGGLVTGLLLAKAGKKVCILEKNKQYGGNLQTFVRDREIFDSGVHYLGSLDENQNLFRFWKHLGVLDHITLERMDLDQFDVIRFKDDPQIYPHAQGHQNFIDKLGAIFPEEKVALAKYIDTLKEFCSKFPLYELREGYKYDHEIMSKNCQEVISGITSNRKLQAVLLGNGFLYGLHAQSPFYMHALVLNSYIQSAWRCIKGGSQISKTFVKLLRKHQAELYNNQEVIKLNFQKNVLVSCETEDYEYKATHFISNISVLKLFKLFDSFNYNKPYVKRISELKEGPSAFSLHIVLKPNKIRYFKHNIYHFDSPEVVFNYNNIWEGTHPKMVITTCSPHQQGQEYTSNISMLTYMNADQVKPWKETFNTTQHPHNRGEEYHKFKQKIAEEMIDVLSIYFPDIRKHIVSIHSSTPLTYRDYIGSVSGAMYGIEKFASDPLASKISPKTKVNNLFLTGQDVIMHGILGVTISGFLTAGEILGNEIVFKDLFKTARNA